ncbi:MAG: hypothetical protein IPO91_03555 [Chloroflexi bacterium]|nr:hypothetical protein [Chloroflexota bacterium]
MQSRIAFYAYSSHNIATSFTVQNAIEAINSSTREITVIDWATMDNSGKFIIPEICNQIDDADLFLCDLTDLNQNVLFELGYAVATRKRVWVTRQENKQWRDLFYLELGLLDTLGYVPYSNYRDIIDRFLQDMPHHDLDLNIYNQKIEPVKQRIKEPKLLFLKSPASTPSASSLNRLLMKSKFRDVLATDDPLETSVRSFEWYIENLLSSFAVISEFSSPPFDSKNAKYGFISGLAYGMNKLPLLIAQGPFDAPFDYKDSLYTYTDETERDAYVTEWLERKQTQYDKQLQTYKRYRRQQQRLEERQALRNINLGEYEAELERDQLVHYFVQTDSFNQALRNATYIIFSGRKGSGKTANFLRLAQHMRDAKSENNFVCVIKPLTYDISGVFQLYKSQLYNSVKMHVMETLWKFLIYTELARDLREHLDEKPEQLLSSEEKHLISFVDRTDYIKDDFTIRLDA